MAAAGRSILGAALLAGAVIGVMLTVSLNRESCTTADQIESPMVLPVSRAERSLKGLPDFTRLVDHLRPSVVNIAVSEDVNSRLRQRRSQRDPFGFFPFVPSVPRQSLGSGFILDEEGYIITNHHVVADATKIVVRLHNDKEYDAEVIGSDEKTDIAVIKIEPVEELQAVAFGDSDELNVGEWVLAIGNPFGLDSTVTAGIVSAKSRRIHAGNPYDDFIQTDAAINPGNSGGPLINLAGQVVGINTAIFSRSGGNIGIGFAIPINMARTAVPQLKEFGHVTRGWLGVRIQSVDDDIAESLNLDEAAGALVASVFEGSPAEEAGIETGDVIVSFDGRKVEKSADLPAIVAATPPGESVNVGIMRDGRALAIEVTIAKMKDDEVSARPVKAEELGLSVQDITPELADELGVESDAPGVVISSVVNGSPAAEVGLRPGDIIEQVGNKPVDSAKEFREMLADRDKGSSVLVLVRRGDETLFRVIKPGEE